MARCYDCGRDKPIASRTKKSVKAPFGHPLCSACSQRRKGAKDPFYKLERAVSTQNCRNSTGRISVDQLTRLLCRQNFQCAYCGTGIHYKQSIDHVKPQVAGGPNVIQNTVLVCVECNSSKQHKHVLVWLEVKKYNLSPIVKERIEWLKKENLF